MIRIRKQYGFSLTEMLIATGIMAVGLVMVATIFPVGIKLTSVATERSIGATVAQEAFAKIQLYGIRDFVHWPAAIMKPLPNGDPDPSATYYTSCYYRYVTGYAGPDGQFYNPPVNPTRDDNCLEAGRDGKWMTTDDIKWDSEFLYPSTKLSGFEKQRYCWSALCLRLDEKAVQVTVFVSRKTSDISSYRAWSYDYTTKTYVPSNTNNEWPSPVPFMAGYNPGYPREFGPPQTPKGISNNALWASLTSPDNVERFFSDSFWIVDDDTGGIYQLQHKVYNGGGFMLLLNKDWPGGLTKYDETIWLVPPAVGSDRYPCVGVYQKVMYFENVK